LVQPGNEGTLKWPYDNEKFWEELPKDASIQVKMNQEEMRKYEKAYNKKENKEQWLSWLKVRIMGGMECTKKLIIKTFKFNRVLKGG
jgi:hypothetical protein